MRLCLRLSAGVHVRAAGQRLAPVQRNVGAFSTSDEQQAGDEDKALRFKPQNRRAPVKSKGESKNLINAMNGALRFEELRVLFWNKLNRVHSWFATCRAVKRTTDAFKGDHVRFRA
jgi:hypothetical protein